MTSAVLRDANRLFVALDLPDAPRRRLAALARDVADDGRGRAVPEENLHMTLCFLGRVDPPRGPGLVDAVRESAAAAVPAPSRVTGLRGRPSARRARLCAAVLDDAEGLLAGAWAEVRARVSAAAGAPAEERAFWPHVTLARFPRPARVRETVLPDEHAFAFDRLSLYDSHMGRGGPPSYLPVATFPLGSVTTS